MSKILSFEYVKIMEKLFVKMDVDIYPLSELATIAHDKVFAGKKLSKDEYAALKEELFEILDANPITCDQCRSRIPKEYLGDSWTMSGLCLECEHFNSQITSQEHFQFGR